MKRQKLMQNPLPINSTAYRVVCGPVEHWEPRKKAVGAETFDAPPTPLGERPENCLDYSGLRRDRMVIFRFHESKDGSIWLARCDCGKYEFRRAKRWSEKLHLPDACCICRAACYSKTGRSYGDKRTDKEDPGRKAARA